MGITYPSCPSRVAELNRWEKATEMYLEASLLSFRPHMRAYACGFWGPPLILLLKA